MVTGHKGQCLSISRFKISLNDHLGICADPPLSFDTSVVIAFTVYIQGGKLGGIVFVKSLISYSQHVQSFQYYIVFGSTRIQISVNVLMNMNFS